MTIPKALEVPGYQVMQFLGNGARSTIWQIRDRETNQLYTLKRVVKREPSDVRFLEQATNEYDIASQLHHPVLRRAIQLRKVKRWLSLREIHLVMEYCEGQTLQEDRPQDVSKVVQVFISVGHALDYMNSRGFVHADIKPNNIVVAPDGAVKVIDMGQSCRVGTIKERIQGTPDFIAPEQVHRRPLDGRTDVFNFAAALYWTLTGQAIPTVLSKSGPITLVTDIDIPPAHELNPDVPQSLSKLIEDCTGIQPSRRIRSMKDVTARLDLLAHKIARDAELETETETEPHLVTELNDESDAETKTKPQSQPGEELQIEPETNLDAEAQTDMDADLDTEAEIDLAAELNAELDAELAADAEAERAAKRDAELDAEAKREPDA